MTDWNLGDILSALHQDIQQRLETVRTTMGHPGSKGDASEGIWLKLLQTYLPKRYQSETAFVADSKGNFSDQIDVVIFYQQYTPFIFHYEGEIVVPAEAVYAVFETKQTISKDLIAYACDKVKSVRVLHRTSLPIPHAGGTYDPKPLNTIIGGILALESDWSSPPLGNSMEKALNAEVDDLSRLEIGCVAAHGFFNFNEGDHFYQIRETGKPATLFLFKLISMLQMKATVPMIDIMAYAKWLDEPTSPNDRQDTQP